MYKCAVRQSLRLNGEIITIRLWKYVKALKDISTVKCRTREDGYLLFVLYIRFKYCTLFRNSTGDTPVTEKCGDELCNGPVFLAYKWTDNDLQSTCPSCSTSIADHMVSPFPRNFDFFSCSVRLAGFPFINWTGSEHCAVVQLRAKTNNSFTSIGTVDNSPSNSTLCMTWKQA